MFDISRHMSPVYRAMCLNMLPPYLVWWAPGCAPQCVHSRLPSTAQVLPSCLPDTYIHVTETQTCHTSLFPKQDSVLFQVKCVE
jgi:hypothetical protein